MFKEAKSQSPFYRKVMGTVTLSIGLIIGLLSGFSFYNPDMGVILTVCATGMTLLGIGTVTDAMKAKYKNNKHESIN